MSCPQPPSPHKNTPVLQAFPSQTSHNNNSNNNAYRIVSSTVADHQTNVFHKIHRRRVLKRVKLFLDDGQVDGIFDDFVIIR